MKHTKKITAILLVMFILTQIIGLLVISAYSPKQITVINQTTGEKESTTISPKLPYGMQPSEIKPEISLFSIIIAFAIAVFLILILTKLKAELFLKIWFFIVVILALGITINSLFLNFHLPNLAVYSAYLALIIAIPLAVFKVWKRNIIIHNITELLIYPGIAAVFVPILSVPTIIILLVLISGYDIYAVWHTGFMQKMAKFQINELGIFGGFFIPYASKKMKEKIKKIKSKLAKLKTNSAKQKLAKQAKIKINLAILGGGDIVFPIIMSGVIFRNSNFGLIPAIFTTLGASLALFWLFIKAKKAKPYPAMPFISSGCFFGFALGMIINLLV